MSHEWAEMRIKSSDTWPQTSVAATAMHPGPWWAGVSGGQYTEVQDTSESEEGKVEIPEGVKVPRAESPRAAKRNKGLVGKSPILAGDESRDPNRCFHE